MCVCMDVWAQIPSLLLVKSQGYWEELEFISLPNIGGPLSLKLVVSKRTDNSSTFLFIFSQFLILSEQMPQRLSGRL